MEYIDDYIAVKHGQKVKYPHPLLEEVLQPTNGVFVYQEQVMKAAQIIAGYSLGGADLLRRAMGKKKVEEMAEQRSVFVEGAAKNNIGEEKANEIFDYIDKFAGYGFNKSHSVAYALISYQTAWLKAHYPTAFMAALLSSMMRDSEKIAVVVKQVAKMGLIIEAPNVNESFFNFTIKDDKTIFYGLGAIKGVGKAVVAELVEFRKTQKVVDFFNFCAGFVWGTINRRMLEALIFSGALDILKVDRATLNANIEIALKEAQQKHFDDLRGQESLFAVTQTQFLKMDLKVVEPWLELEQLKKEKEVLGFYFSRHPVDIYDDIATALKLQTPTQLSFRNNREVRLIGLLEMVNYRNLQKGQMAHITLEDGKTQIPIVVFSKQLINCSENLIVNKVVVIEGQVRKDFRGDWQVVASNVDLIETIKLKRAKSLLIVLDETQQKQFKTIVNTLRSHQGNCPVQFDYQTKKTQGSLFLSSDWNVKPDDELLNSLNNFQKRLLK
jgi:DNA polymerase-3 subunit alpha